eukprot:scaffold84930_cov32-Attheya_sp.AAC.1
MYRCRLPGTGTGTYDYEFAHQQRVSHFPLRYIGVLKGRYNLTDPGSFKNSYNFYRGSDLKRIQSSSMRLSRRV